MTKEEASEMEQVREMIGRGMDVNIGWNVTVELKKKDADRVDDVIDAFDPSYGFIVETSENEESVLIRFSGDACQPEFEEVSPENVAYDMSLIRGCLEGAAEKVGEKCPVVVGSTDVDVYYW